MGKYEEYEKEELIKIIQQQEAELKYKKYGLVWDAEREPEQVVLDCENSLPILKHITSKTINTCDAEDNILIEGDNYHALSVLNYTHKEKIDVIYIDPPYNTGSKDFIYNDRYVDKEDGYRHSKWLNFMEKRLNLAKELLNKTGVIFLSIDDNEVSQLKLLCDKVFSQKRYVGTLIWEKKKKGSHLNNSITNIKEYVLVYCKDEKNFTGLVGETSIKRETYPCVNPGNTVGKRLFKKGIPSKYKEKNFILKKGETISAGNMSLLLHTDLIIENSILKEDLVLESEWRYSQEALSAYANKGELYITNKLYFRRIVVDPRDKQLKDLLPRVEYQAIIDKQEELIKELKKDYDEKDDYIIEMLSSEVENLHNQNYESLDSYNLFNDGWGSNEDGDIELRDFFGSKVFDYPKPSKLIAKLLASTRNKEATVLDFMAGTGTTAQAILELNKLDDGNRKFILCTNNENGICTNITYPRIEKVTNGYKLRGSGENVEGLGGNVQYFKTSLLKKSNNRHQTKLNLTNKCAEMLCVKENIFNIEKNSDDFKFYSSHDKTKYLCIYFNTIDDSFDEFIEELKSIDADKKVYMFSDDLNIDKESFKEIDNCSIEAIPQKILDIYKQLIKMNIPIKPSTIFTDLAKAKKRIYTEKDKDDGAFKLRIVLEKTIQKIAQNSGVSILKPNGKEEKVENVNNTLKKDGVFSKVIWEENKTYMAIGNHAAHGDYDEYDLKQVENFYRYAQSLIDGFNIG
ncbi:MAG: site-specific DNA-methyltransferase [Campylobacterota bacterium]|nr:site-specific DNA-methyltransferase [Campylobacterota bacterium]